MTTTPWIGGRASPSSSTDWPRHCRALATDAAKRRRADAPTRSATIWTHQSRCLARGGAEITSCRPRAVGVAIAPMNVRHVCVVMWPKDRASTCGRMKNTALQRFFAVFHFARDTCWRRIISGKLRRLSRVRLVAHVSAGRG